MTKELEDAYLEGIPQYRCENINDFCNSLVAYCIENNIDCPIKEGEFFGQVGVAKAYTNIYNCYINTFKEEMGITQEQLAKPYQQFALAVLLSYTEYCQYTDEEEEVSSTPMRVPSSLVGFYKDWLEFEYITSVNEPLSVQFMLNGSEEEPIFETKKAEPTTEKEETGTKKTEVDSDLPEMYNSIIDNSVDEVLAVYQKLYAPGFDLFKPEGILTSKGYLHADMQNNQVTEVQDIEMMKLYQFLNKKYNGAFTQTNGNCALTYKNITESGAFYFPHYQVRNVLGVLVNGSLARQYSEVKSELKSRVKECFEVSLKALGKAKLQEVDIKVINQVLDTVSKALKTVVIVSEYKKGVDIKLKICIGDAICTITERDILSAINSREILTTQTEVDLFEYSSEVLNLNLVLNKQKYNGYPLFAFQVLESFRRNNLQANWGNVILGKNIDDTVFTTNLEAVDTLALIAGSRAGKGVMTLNLLASAYGSNYPVVYLDFKPDMSETLKNIAIKNGVPTFAIDGSSKNLFSDYNMFADFDNLPEFIKARLVDFSKNSFALITSYVHSIEVMLEICLLRKDKGKEAHGGKRVVFILDEFESFSVQTDDMCKKMLQWKKTLKAQKITDGSLEYIENYLAWIDSINTTLSSAFTQIFGKAGVTAIFIWQSVNVLNKGIFLDTVGRNASSTMYRILGNGTFSDTGSGVIGTRNLGAKGVKYLQEYHFCFKDKGKIQEGDTSAVIFKPYMVLNEAVEGADCIVQLRNRAPGIDSVILDENGKLIEAIGFEGYAKELLNVSSLAPYLRSGYDLATTSLQEIGLSNSLEEHIYNFSTFTTPSKAVGSEEEFEGVETGNDLDFDLGVSTPIDSEESEEINIPLTSEEEATYSSMYNTSLPEDEIPEPIVNPQFSKVMFNGQEVDFSVLEEPLQGLEDCSWVKDGKIDTAQALYDVGDILDKYITQMFGDLSRITQVTVKDKYLFLNNIQVSPKVDAIIIQCMPIDIRGAIATGRWADMFIFSTMQDYKNLSIISIDNEEFFLTKVLTDYGIPRRRFKPEYMFKAHNSLVLLKIGNTKVTYEDIANNTYQPTRGMQKANQSSDIQRALSGTAGSRDYFNLSDWYNSDNVQRNVRNTKRVVGISALGALALVTPVGAAIALGLYTGNQMQKNKVGSRIKNGFGAFAEAFRNSL